MAMNTFACDMRELNAVYNRVYHRVSYSEDAHQLISEVISDTDTNY